MKQYLSLVKAVMDKGHDVPDRTGTGTRSIFGHQMRFDLNQGFPLVTSKRTFWKGAFVEMLWILRGDTNIKWLQKHGVHIWDEWADANGNLGPVYGAQWHHHSQLGNLIDGLKNDPHSRRHIISAWNPVDLPARHLSPQDNVEAGLMALAPCHCLVQFYVNGHNQLSCQLYQRSADVFLGVPFNIAGYALLTHLLAHHLGYGVGEFIWSGGDVHLYSNHMQQAKELLTRNPQPLPELTLSHERDKALWAVEPSDLNIVNYTPLSAIKAPVSV